MHDSVRDYWHEFNRPLEGRVYWMYLDVKGYVSTAVGILIDATAAPLSPPSQDERERSLALVRPIAWQVDGVLEGDQVVGGTLASEDQIDAEWDYVKSRMDLAPQGGGTFAGVTSLRIDGAELDRLVGEKLDQMETYLRNRSHNGVQDFPGYDSWPADAQLGLLSMSWGMGPAFNFPKFQGHVQAGDWLGAADECRFNPEIGTIVKRNDWNQQLFRNAAGVVASGADPSQLVFPGVA